MSDFNVNGTQNIILAKLFTDNGISTGSPNAALDYSSTPGRVYIKPPSDQTYRITNLLATVFGSGTFRPDTYGPLSELTNGVVLSLTSNDGMGGRKDIFRTARPVKNNIEYNATGGEISLKQFGGGDEYLVIDWDFQRLFGQSLRIHGKYEDELSIELNDDFDSLQIHEFRGVGYVENTPR